MEIKSWAELTDELSNKGSFLRKPDETQVTATERFRIAREHVAKSFPMDLSICTGVQYDSKTDRYVGKFEFGSKKHSLKLTIAVAKFLLANQEQRDESGNRRAFTIYGRMADDGSLEDVLLVSI